MAVNPSSQIYCCGPCGSSGGNGVQNGGHTIRRNDTCPVMEIEVRGKNGDGVDLTGWTAEGYLFGLTLLSNDLPDNETEMWVEDTALIRRGDDLRIESMDGSEWVNVTTIDRTLGSMEVARAQKDTLPATHEMDTPIYILRSEEIPVDIAMESYTLGQREDIVFVEDDDKLDDNIVGSVDNEDRIKRSILTVRWRVGDTAVSGKFYLQINLSGPNGERLTLPRNGPGYPITVVNDADNLI